MITNVASDQPIGLILIVDDLPNNLRLLRDTLENQGYEVRSTTKGKTALRAAQTILPDLILLDVRMPDLDGYEVCRQLKTTPETEAIPVIFLSALNETVDKVKGFIAGGVDFISKPFQVQEVLVRVKTHLTLKHLQENLRQQNQTLLAEIEKCKQIEQELFAEKELAQVTLHSIGDGVITTDQWGHIKYLNPVAEKLTGWTITEVKGLRLTEIIGMKDELTGVSQENPLMQALQQGKIIQLDDNSLLIGKDGIERAIGDSAAPIRDYQGQIIGGVMVFHDVTESRTLSRQLSWQATHDPLTELYNRSAFENFLRQALTSIKNNPQTRHSLCYLDLDQFKIVNDTCGHKAGDELLCQITTILQKRIRAKDILARLGGDEFCLLLYDCTLEKAIEIANILRSLVGEFCFTWQDKVFYVGVSIGIVEVTENSLDLHQVIKTADEACLAAKRQGRNRVLAYPTLFQDSLTDHQEKQWISYLNHALEKDSFYLYTQPIIPIYSSHSIPLSEILLRLKDENNQLIAPMAFLPSAERYGLMPAIDRWVITTFLKRYQAYYQKVTENHIPLNRIYLLNLSGMSFIHADFQLFLYEQLSQVPDLATTLGFEITETAMMSNSTQATALIETLKPLGCRFAIDGFGSGISSFNYFKHLPIDYLKIDGNLILNLGDNPFNTVMLESLHKLCQVLNIQTIAESVENPLILSKIQELGLDYAQGYAIAYPDVLDL